MSTSKMTDNEIAIASKKWRAVEQSDSRGTYLSTLGDYRDFLQVVELRQRVDPQGKIPIKDEPESKGTQAMQLIGSAQRLMALICEDSIVEEWTEEAKAWMEQYDAFHQFISSEEGPLEALAEDMLPKREEKAEPVPA